MDELTVGLGMSRLAILDLSSAGNQPMEYKELSIIFNGEIYNFLEIRAQLESIGHRFVSNSDTEVLLHAFDQWGEGFIRYLIGMFVIVIYDRAKEKLLIFRDRAGVKPIFYYWNNGVFMFASELKALFRHRKFEKEIDLRSLSLYFDFGYIPSPYTIFTNTFKIKPGHYLIFELKRKTYVLNQYWNIDTYYKLPKLDWNYFEAKERIRDILISSCNYRMIADVPVGVFLSGGYGSSTVTSILQQGNGTSLKTFTIGFEEGNNEANYAHAIANYLGTDHTEYICTTKEAQEIIPLLPYFFDEPFADSSAIPTMLVSRVARSTVKVALSADGGDEVFAGYSIYSKFEKYSGYLNRLPNQSYKILKPSLNLLSSLLPSTKSALKHKLLSISNSLNANEFSQFINLRRFGSSLPEYFQKRLFSFVVDKYPTKYDDDFSQFINTMDIALSIDYETYLSDDILTKVDRSTMSTSLEGREPLVDHRLSEVAAQLPVEYKFDPKGGKRILKDIVHEYLPVKLVDRPKAGFTLPIYSWLNGDLSYLLDEFCSERAIRKNDIINPGFIRQQIALFKENKLYYKPLIWKILMFQMWYAEWMK
jgi:asparagine synthase (glutamine-hydrolysing)